MSAAGTAEVLIVGGGVVGCSVAWSLAREGLDVRLLERGAIAGEASGAAAGMLAPIAEAEDDGPLLRWGRRSLERFPSVAAELRERSGIDPEHVQSGILRVAASEAEAQALRERVARMFDAHLEWLGPEALRAEAPSLRAGLLGALWSPTEAHVRSPLLVRAYARAAEQRGARIEEGIPVTGLLREGARILGVQTALGQVHAGTVVLCTGSFSRVCESWLGSAVVLPIFPVRGQIVCLDSPQPPLGTIAWGEDVYLVPKRDGSVVVGATVERVGYDRRVTAGGIRGLLEAAEGLAPPLGRARFRTAWAGLRPGTPDHLPMLGPVPGAEGLLMAAGHYRNGVLLSPVTGELLRDGLLGKGWEEPAFLPERFLG